MGGLPLLTDDPKLVFAECVVMCDAEFSFKEEPRENELFISDTGVPPEVAPRPIGKDSPCGDSLWNFFWRASEDAALFVGGNPEL